MIFRLTGGFKKVGITLKFAITGILLVVIAITAASCASGSKVMDTKEQMSISPISDSAAVSVPVSRNETARTQSPAINLKTNGKQGKASISDLTVSPEMYAAYYKILQERIDEYGTLTPYEYDGVNNVVLLCQTGVAYAALLDFDGNGKEELLICYNDKESVQSKYVDASSPCTYEVWGYNGSSYLIAKERATVFGGGSMIRGYFDVYNKDKNFYVVNSIAHKEIEDGNVIWYYHQIYSTLKAGKWVTGEIDGNENNNSAAPWDGGEHIIRFNEIDYTLEDAHRLQSVLTELKKYGKE